jgi:HEAT repeat protein
MKSSASAFLSLLLCAVAATPSSTQEDKPPDFKSKSLAQWLAALKTGNDRWAPSALGPHGPYAKEAIPMLIESFKDKDWQNPFEPVYTLRSHGSVVVPPLVEALKNTEPRIRAGAADTLSDLTPKPKSAIPALIVAAKDDDALVRRSALWSLGQVGRTSIEAIQAITAALHDPNVEVRRKAAEVFAEWYRRNPKKKPAIPALILSLNDKDEEVRGFAVQGLRNIGPDAKAAVPALLAGLKDEANRSFHKDIIDALGEMGPAAKVAIPTIQDALKDAKLRRSAAWALGEMGPEAKTAVPALMEIVKKGIPDNDPQYAATWARQAAIRALGLIGPGAKDAVPLLMEAFHWKASYTGFYSEVAEALGDIGPDAKAAVPMLVEYARNLKEDRQIGEYCCKAVMKIDPDTAAKLHLETAYLNIRLGKIPALKLQPRPASSDTEKKEIKSLIAKLADIDSPGYGMAQTISGRAFSPVAGHEHAGTLLLTDHQLQRSDVLTRLAAKGPAALPFLLDALEDKTPTKLRMDRGGLLWMSFSHELDINPLNPTERSVAEKKSDRKEENDDEESETDPLCVGDICFVAIGQIVGRAYQAVHYVPTGGAVVNSPARDKEYRERIRAIWSSPDPTKKLFDSLLFDYATEGVFDGKELYGSSQATEMQAEAAMRLLYYFPNESATMLAERLKRMDVSKPKPDSEDWQRRDLANGVGVTEFVAAVIWCKEPTIREVLTDIFRRTDDKRVMLAALPAVQETHPELIIPRFQPMLKALPAAERWYLDDGFHLLLALGESAGKAAKPEFERYLKDASLQRRWTMCWVMEKLHSEWALEFLVPMLTDKRTGFSGDARLCDVAASALSEIYPDLKFDSEGTPEELDRRIEKMREQIAKKKK